MGLVILLLVLLILSAVICGVLHWLTDGDGLVTLITAVVCLVIMLIAGIYTYASAFANERTITCTVTNKDRGGDDGSYRVYTSDCGVLANTDVLTRGKFDSADVWNQIPQSGTIKVHVAGSRVQFLSMFPNILEVVQ